MTGYSVLTTEGDTWIVAELTASLGRYEELVPDVMQLLPTRRPTTA